MNKQEIGRSALGRTILVGSIAQLTSADAGSVVLAATRGGTSAAQFALAVPLRLVVFNDAGVGKDAAGITGQAIL